MDVASIKRLIEERRIIVIVRRMYGTQLFRLVEALREGGMELFEVTFDQSAPDCIERTAGMIEELNRRYGGESLFGAGTVLSTAQVDAAADAGSKYIISPNTCPDVIRRSKERDMVSIPGAMTPSEMLTAHDCGADYVKVFPACDLGLKYIKNVKAPLSHLKFIATAGVNDANLSEYLAAGYVGAGISSCLTDRRLIEEGNFEELTRRAAVLSDIVRRFNEGK